MPDENNNPDFEEFNFDPETDLPKRKFPPWVLLFIGLAASGLFVCGLIINYTMTQPETNTQATVIAQNLVITEQSDDSNIVIASSTPETAVQQTETPTAQATKTSTSQPPITPEQTEEVNLPTSTPTAVVIPATESPTPSIPNTISPEDSIHNVRRYTTAVYDQANLLIIIDSLDKRIEASPSAENFALRGNVYVHLRQYAFAQNDYLEAIKLQTAPEDAALYTQLAVVTFYLGEIEDAHMYFDRALELDGQFYPAYVGRAQVFRIQGDFDKAVEDIQAALTHGAEQDSLVHYHLAEIYAHANRYDEFHATMLRVLELQPDHPVYVNGFCWLGSIIGHATDVMSYCEQSVSFQHHPDTYDSRGLARALSGDTVGAIDDFLYFVTYTDQSEKFATFRQQRLDWIKALEAGEDPFTPELLASLLYQ